jgi:hypothetical protein
LETSQRLPAPIAAGVTPRTMPGGTPVVETTPVVSASPGTPVVTAPIAPAPRGTLTTVTSPEDKGARDPAAFPRPEGTVRASYTAIRQKGYVQESATYTASKNSYTLMAYYESVLTSDGWEETSRNENNYATDGAHQYISSWKKDNRSASITLIDIAPDKVQIRISVDVTS